MYATFNAWKEKVKHQILDLGGRLEPDGKVASQRRERTSRARARGRAVAVRPRSAAPAAGFDRRPSRSVNASPFATHARRLSSPAMAGGAT